MEEGGGYEVSLGGRGRDATKHGEEKNSMEGVRGGNAGGGGRGDAAKLQQHCPPPRLSEERQQPLQYVRAVVLVDPLALLLPGL